MENFEVFKKILKTVKNFNKILNLEEIDVKCHIIFFLIDFLPKLWGSKPIVNFFHQTLGEQLLPCSHLPHPMIDRIA